MRSQTAHLSRAVVLQTILAAGIAAAWIAGIAQLPFQGDNAILCWSIVAVGAIGTLYVFLRRWSDAAWIAKHVVRFGLLGTVVGLIMAFSHARSVGADADAIQGMVGQVVDGMYVALYATFMGVGVNLWLKLNMKLLAPRGTPECD
jgi:hypothetical protein